jgi:hypothetical protein
MPLLNRLRRSHTPRPHGLHHRSRTPPQSTCHHSPKPVTSPLTAQHLPSPPPLSHQRTRSTPKPTHRRRRHLLLSAFPISLISRHVYPRHHPHALMPLPRHHLTPRALINPLLLSATSTSPARTPSQATPSAPFTPKPYQVHLHPQCPPTSRGRLICWSDMILYPTWSNKFYIAVNFT